MSTARCQENHDHRITSWNGPQPMATFPPTEEEEEEGKEEVIRAKRLINSHAFRKLFPSPFVHPFRNLFATSIPLRDIAVCKYHVLHPFFFLLSTLFLSTLPSCLLVNHANVYPQRIRFPRSNRGIGSRILRPEREREREIIIAFHGKICKFVCRYATS